MSSPGAEAPDSSDPLGFLAGGGEMGRRTRAFDWSETPLGPAADWPQSLKTAASIMLGCEYPLLIWWGPGLIHLYNDAYLPVLGMRHPSALGRPAPEVWSEAWPTVGPQADAVMREGRSYWNEELPILMTRNGYPEEVYMTFSYGPIRDDAGRVEGLFCACTEETQRVLGRRRLRTLRAVADRTAEAKSAEAACAAAAEALADDPHDLPFALLYLLDARGRRANLEGLVGVTPEAAAEFAVVDLATAGSVWGFGRVVETGRPVDVDGLPWDLPPVPGAVLPVAPSRAVVLPLSKPGQDELAGFLVAGVGPLRPLDDDYRGFLGLLAGQTATAVASARAYEEERRRAEALAELDRAKTAFFSNVSHEFRTPLTLILGPVEDLLGRGDAQVEPSAKGQLEVVHRNGLRLLKLVNSMLDFSRIEAGRVRASYEPTDLAAYTAELAGVFRAAVERAGLRLVVDCPPLPGPAYVDRDMWEKVVLNLLSNAFKFTLDGGIELKVEAVEGRARLTVRDTGVGIPAEEMPRIFDRFHRVKETRGRTHEGTGIGLALVQELVRLHGGTVSAASELSRGSRFMVEIPLGKDHLDPDRIETPTGLAPTATGADAFVQEALRWLPGGEPDAGPAPGLVGAMPSFLAVDAEAIPAAADGPRPRVLWADDNADMREYVARLLGGRFDVEAVPDGRAALDAARARPPDLVLSDVMMPRLDGLGLLRELRADPRLRQVPVILMSARAGEDARVQGMAEGADDYLVKPFSARELVARVDAHLRLARERREAAAAVRRSEERLRRMVNVDGVGVLVFALPEGPLIDANDYFLRMFGYTREEVRAGRLTWRNMTPPEHVSESERQLERFAATGRIGPYEKEYLRRDGSRAWMVFAGAALGDGTVVEYCIDVSDRKRAEAALRGAMADRTELLRRLVTAQEDERRRVARDLHDGLGQELTALILGLKALEQSVPEDAPGRDRLREVERIVNVIGREAHDLAVELRPTALDDLGLPAALTAYVDRWSERTGIAADFEPVGLGGDRLPPEVETTAYRVVQEALNNVAKHAGARRVTVMVSRQGGELVAMVEDDGRGFDPGRDGLGSGGRSLGLLGMRERVGLVGGALVIESGEGEGTVVQARIPLVLTPEEARHGG